MKKLARQLKNTQPKARSTFNMGTDPDLDPKNSLETYQEDLYYREFYKDILEENFYLDQ